MKKILFSVAGLLFTASVFGQLLNGDFEINLSSPNYIQDNQNFVPVKFAQSWTTPNYGSPDLFTGSSASCGNINSPVDNPSNYSCYPQVCTWGNLYGQQTPYSGDNYVGISAGNEYIQTQINPQQYPNGLAAGQCFRVSFYTSRGDRSQFAARLQVVLSKTNQYYNQSGPIPYNADDIVLTTDEIIYNKTGWELVTFSFKATGGEKYLTIGLFDNNGYYDGAGNFVVAMLPEFTMPGDCNNTTSQSSGCTSCVWNGASGEAYYYIDLVSLVPIGQNTFLNPIVYTAGNANITTSHSNANILISGNVNIASNVTFTNCDIQFNAGSSITVNGNQTFTLDNSRLSVGCALMWEGIFVNPGGTIVTQNNTLIQDAHQAIVCNNANWRLSNTTFNKNGQDLVLKNVNSSTSNYIYGCLFNDQNTLSDPSYNASGRTEYGVNIVSAQNNAAPVVVGGTAPGQGSTFVGGIAGIISTGYNFDVLNSTFSSCQRGIKAVSCDVNVTGSTFSNGFLGIDFSHIVASLPKYSLTVHNSTFNNTYGIQSYQRTNCTVTKSNFNDCSIGVNWYSNHDCDLIIGTDNLLSGLGNQFRGCSYPVILSDNKSTAQSSFAIYQNDDPSNIDYTDILISGNQFYGQPGKQTNQCISIMEFTLGNSVNYHSLEIQDNLMSEVSRGIELSNVHGMWQYLSSFQNPSDNVAHSWVNKNTIGVITTYSSTAKGINLVQSPGMKVIANGISSDAPGHWQNNGIRSINSEASILVGNAVQAGTGILMAQNAVKSKIYCNSLAGNSCGINLAQTRLNILGTYQGYWNAQGIWEAYTNNFTSPNIPWAVNYQNYLSNTGDNLWIWDNSVSLNSPKVWNSAANALESNMQNSSLISAPSQFSNGNPFIGQYACDYYPVYGGAFTNVTFSQSPNVRPVLADAVAQWTADYYYQGVKNSTGQGNSGNVSQKVMDILAIEEAIGARDFVLANSILAGYTPTNIVEQNYKTVLQTLVAVNYPQMRITTEAEKNSLLGVAQQKMATGGLAVNLARAYLFANYLITFEDDDNYASGEVSGKITAAANCPAGTLTDMAVVLINSANQSLSLTGGKVQENGTFAFDPFQLRYLAAQNPGITYRIAVQKGNSLVVLDNTARTLDNWMAQPVLNYTYTCTGGARLADQSQPETLAMVYPNPNEGAFTVALPEGEKATIALYSLTGQLVHSQQVNQTVVLQLDVNQVPNGVYLLQITSVNGNVQTEKLVINRK
jgi:hypothetical protein